MERLSGLPGVEKEKETEENEADSCKTLWVLSFFPAEEKNDTDTLC